MQDKPEASLYQYKTTVHDVTVMLSQRQFLQLCCIACLLLGCVTSCWAQTPNQVHLVRLSSEASEWDFGLSKDRDQKDRLVLWLIRAEPKSRVSLTFNLSSLEPGQTCRPFIKNGYGVFSLEGPQVGLSNATRPEVVFKGPEASLIFWDDFCLGFSATAKQKPDNDIRSCSNPEAFQCRSQSDGLMTCLERTALCDGFNHCPDGSDENDCKDPCGERLMINSTALPLRLASPYYELTEYPDNVDCSWLIAASDGLVVTFNFSHFEVEELDFLTIGNGHNDSDETSIISRLSGDLLKSYLWVSSSGARAWVRFQSTGDKSKRGFSVIVSEETARDSCKDGKVSCSGQGVGMVCMDKSAICDGFRHCLNGLDESLDECECSGSMLLNSAMPSVVLQSPYFPRNYHNDQLCLWFITASDGYVVTFNVSFFDLRKNDNLTIGNGQNPLDRSSIIAHLSRKIPPGAMVSSKESTVWVAFHSDHSITEKGFSVTVTQEPLQKSCRDGYFSCNLSPNGLTCLSNAYRGICHQIEACRRTNAFCNEYICPEDCRCNFEDEVAVICPYWNPQNLTGLRDSVQTLFLLDVNISNLDKEPFGSMPNLDVLVLQDTSGSTVIHNNTFAGLTNLSTLVIFDLSLSRIYQGAFTGMGKIDTMTLMDRGKASEFPEIDDHEFDGLGLSFLGVDDYRLCCLFNETIKTKCREWLEVPQLFGCKELIPRVVLKVFIWILGVSAISGNLWVMIWRCREKTKGSDTQKIQSFLVFNLAASDALMGLYMLIIASTDAYHGAGYFEVSDEWRVSILCQVTGFISVIANEASVLFLSLISVDRFLFIVFPFFSKGHLSPKTFRIAAFCIWAVTVAIATTSTVLASNSSATAYGLSDVCIGLPLTPGVQYEMKKQEFNVTGLDTLSYARPVLSQTGVTWIFSIVIFLGLNLFCFCLILVCYIAIFVTVKRSKRRLRRHTTQQDKNEIGMALKMAAIIMTDFTCWMPVIIMGIITQAGVTTIDPEVFVWCVVFILPINSSINPYLYTILDINSQRKRKSAQEENKKNNLPLEGVK